MSSRLATRRSPSCLARRSARSRPSRSSVITASVDDASPVITVQAIDQYGNLLTEGGADVDLANDNTGSLDVNDEGDGTYTAPVVETVAPQTDTISGSIDGDPITTGDAEIEFTPGAPSAAQTTIPAAPATVNVDIHHSDITVTAKDQFGNLVGEGGPPSPWPDRTARSSRRRRTPRMAPTRPPSRTR